MLRSALTRSVVLTAALLLLAAWLKPGGLAQQADAPAPQGPIVIEPVGNEMKFATTEITAQAGTEITLVMNNTATLAGMVHNVALLNLEPGDDEGIQAVGMAALQAGPDNAYRPAHEALITATPMAAPGERTEVTFTVPPPGSYPYACLFPGHFVTMRGVLHATP